MADGKNFLSCFVFRYPRHPILQHTLHTYVQEVIRNPLVNVFSHVNVNRGIISIHVVPL